MRLPGDDGVAGACFWHVYLLECADGTYYCGVTNDLARRLAQHNGQRAGGARYTRARRPVRLRAHAPCPDKSCALKLEHRLRTLPRRQKLLVLCALRTPAAARAFAEGGARVCCGWRPAVHCPGPV